MLTRKIFFIFSTSLGVNLNPRKLKVIAFIVTLNFTYFLYLFIESVRSLSRGGFSIFTIIGFIQNDLLLILQIVFLIRGLAKINSTNRIILNINSKFESQSYIAELKFILNVCFLIAVRFSKMGLSAKRYWLYHLEYAFPELAFAASDFMFSYLISLLVEDLKNVKVILRAQNSKMSIKNVLANLSVNRDVQERYSIELLFSIVYNFVQLVISLYYISMRIMFKHLKTPEGLKILHQKFMT